MLFSHVMVGTNDINKARAFYDALFAIIGAESSRVDAKGRCIWSKDGQRFLLGAPIDGESATSANGGTIGFLLPSCEAVDEWHKQGVALGGEAIESPPGIRETPAGKKYLAYLRDLDGNKLCAFFPVE
ncbi:MAG: hypothetical protein XXXJIFNMEKO3_02427 [Candidatus Erwinia impunctatus]|nr:hypothetical protein XXXJIFNMEKO_02427 [Culicoides impunctatus]